MTTPIGVNTADVHAPAANTAAQITYAAVTKRSHIVSGVAWSYSGAPTGGNLKLENGAGSTIFSLDIGTAGAGLIVFPRPKRAAPNTALIVTLAAGGAGVSGKLSVLNHWEE